MAVWVPTVRTIADGEPVAASTDNAPISDLTQRTDWLKNQLDTIAAGTQLVLRDQSIDPGLAPGDVVYLDPTTNIFLAALADIDEDNLNLAGQTAFWQGVVLSAAGGVGDIVIGGSMELAPATWAAAFEDGVFTEGNLYLSAVIPGKLIAEPGTTGIYIGFMRSTGEFLVRLGSPGSFIDHVHLQAVLQGNPAGTVVDPVFNAPQIVTAPDPLEQGWLPATAVYFPGYVVGVQIPVGAQFGYNIQHVNETELRRIFPVLPPSNAQFEQGGLIIPTTKIVTNNFGIWWLDNTYGDAPWPVDYTAAGEVASPIRLWTTRLIASASVLELVIAAIVNELDAGAIDNVAVASLLSGDSSSLEITGTHGDSITGFQGQVTVTNRGVTGYRVGRGIAASAPLGNNTTGYKGLVDASLDTWLGVDHLWTELSGGGDKMVLLTTNGVSSGAAIGMRGHRLGPSIANDYIDFILDTGNDLVAASDYQVTIQLRGCVDTVPGAPVLRDVTVQFYRFSNAAPISDTNLVRVTTASFYEGLPGDMQEVTVGPFADVVVQQDEQILVRIRNNTGGNPLPADTLRLTRVLYELTQV